MDVVLLCAGTSSRMGKTNKLLIPVHNSTMMGFCANQALQYLETLEESSSLIVVTGYRRTSAEKALKACREKVSSSNSRIKLIIVHNANYKKGQFSSVQTGVRQVSENSPFFISLGDMPGITASHYTWLSDKLENHDAVRVQFNNIPGHPVLCSPKMKQAFLSAPSSYKASLVLNKFKVETFAVSDASWVCDIDTPEDISLLN